MEGRQVGLYRGGGQKDGATELCVDSSLAQNTTNYASIPITKYQLLTIDASSTVFLSFFLCIRTFQERAQSKRYLLDGIIVV